MSVHHASKHVGSDGDYVYGQTRIDQWTDRSEFERVLEQELSEIREEMLAEYDRLRAPDESD